MRSIAMPAPGQIRDAVTADARIRLGTWDRLRIVAALDTVALHLTGGHAIFGFGLPLFLILAIALGVSKPEAPPTRRFLSRRSERILMPWLFWSGVLFVGQVWMASRRGQPLLAWLDPRMLLYGPRIHLWFLPFIVVAGLVAHRVHRRFPNAGAPAVLGAVVVAGLCLWIPPQRSFGWPFDQWLFALPAVPLGYALGRGLALAGGLDRFRRAATVGWALFCVVGLAVVAIEPGSRGFLLRTAGGLGLLVVGAWLPARSDGLTRRLAPLMLGVYILHPVVYQWGLKPLFLEAGVHSVRWLRVVVTFPVTMLLVAALRQTPLRRFL